MTASQQMFGVAGIEIGDQVIVVSGVGDPSVIGYPAAIGSMYLRTNGETWKKIGSADTAWQLDAGTLSGAAAYRSIMAMDTYEVEIDVGIVSFNHYYSEGVACKLMSPVIYGRPITIKNLSGNPLTILPDLGRIEGTNQFLLNGKMSSITVAPLQNDWIIIASNGI